MSRKHAGKAVAGLPHPLEITPQQRLEQLKQLAEIFASIFGNLTSEQRAEYVPQPLQKAA